jgi:5-bromo-4-chloroindolyl phosphate hydrolysis protein
MSPENRMKLQQELQAKLQEQRKGLSQEEIAFLKSQLEAKTQPLKELQSMTKLDSEGNRTDRQMYRLDKNEHLNVLKSLDNDKQNVARATAVSNLANAVNNFTAAKIQGPQQLNELQQAVRSNIGIARQSGVGERELTYINSLDQLLTNSEQFWKNKPQSLQSKEIAKHIIELATLEQDNLTAQAQERMSALMTGHETMYDEHPEWREDLDRKAQAILKTYAPSSKGKEYINAPSKKKTAVVKVNSPEPDYSKMSDDELSQIYNAKFGGGQ